jgi:membrane protease subunit (stomatin/prohibitin family)
MAIIQFTRNYTDRSNFCPECGKPLAAKSNCGKCGAEMAAKARFCPECGTPRG